MFLFGDLSTLFALPFKFDRKIASCDKYEDVRRNLRYIVATSGNRDISIAFRLVSHHTRDTTTKNETEDLLEDIIALAQLKSRHAYKRSISIPWNCYIYLCQAAVATRAAPAKANQSEPRQTEHDRNHVGQDSRRYNYRSRITQAWITFHWKHASANRVSRANSHSLNRRRIKQLVRYIRWIWLYATFSTDTGAYVQNYMQYRSLSETTNRICVSPPNRLSSYRIIRIWPGFARNVSSIGQTYTPRYHHLCISWSPCTVAFELPYADSGRGRAYEYSDASLTLTLSGATGFKISFKIVHSLLFLSLVYSFTYIKESWEIDHWLATG